MNDQEEACLFSALSTLEDIRKTQGAIFLTNALKRYYPDLWLHMVKYADHDGIIRTIKLENVKVR